MVRLSPMRSMHQEAEASVALYGPPDSGVEVVETFGDLEIEYAAIRKHCVLLDWPQRGVVEITGSDRIAFLQRMVTQDLKGFEVGHARATFWLNRKGRIDADLTLVEMPDRTLVDVDVHAAERARAGLDAFIIADDVKIEDRSEQLHRLSLHGPTSVELLRHVGEPEWGVAIGDLSPGRACGMRIAGRGVTVFRDDATGEVGLEMIVAASDALAVYQQLIEAGQPHNGDGGTAGRVRLRPAGWHAFNIARMEAGRPLYYIDFGPDSLPHETGILRDRVSFTKGCYLGQEIVARLEARGQPKQILRALKIVDEPAGDADGRHRQPDTGARVLAITGNTVGDVIGAVTSSCLSPMLGSTVVCFAMMRFASAGHGNRVKIETSGGLVDAIVQPSLTFWRKN